MYVKLLIHVRPSIQLALIAYHAFLLVWAKSLVVQLGKEKLA